MDLHTRRIHEPPTPADGLRVLVDRLWPRGVSKQAAAIDLWVRDLAPTHELRRWYGHAPERWPEFCERYSAELDARGPAVAELVAAIGDGPATLLFGSRERRLNNATALKAYLER